MRKLFSLFVVILSGSILFGATNVFAQKKMKKEATIWPAADIKWVEAKDAPPGTMFASIWGNMTKGSYGALVKFGQGMNNPLHTHSSEVKAVVVSGAFWYAPEGGDKKVLGPGSYFMIPSGLKHTSGADPGTVMFQEGPGKFDMKMVAAPKAKK